MARSWPKMVEDWKTAKGAWPAIFSTYLGVR